MSDATEKATLITPSGVVKLIYLSLLKSQVEKQRSKKTRSNTNFFIVLPLNRIAPDEPRNNRN